MTARLALVLLALFALPAWAQTGAPAAGQASDLRLAYEKEYAFLDAQRRALEARLARFQSEAEDERKDLEAEVSRLEKQWLAAQARAQRLQERVAEAERTLGDNRDQGQLLRSVLDQARQTLAASGHAPVPGDDPARDMAAVFTAADAWLADLVRLRRESGAFFLADGRRSEGTLIHLGGIAAYGVSKDGAGALVPAGEGRWRLWPEAAGERSARTLAAGQWPAHLGLYLLDRKLQAAPEAESQGPIDVIQSGGVIAWVIVALGAFAVLLIIARAALLLRAGGRIRTLAQRVAEHLRAGEVAAALAACERSRSAAGRVLAAALRNLDRDREHQDDIISEAILHESADLDRFGGFILVIAAVSPLLGLLGTVTGMIATFDVITEFGTGDPKLLSGGISEALVTTELGLVVAIPVLVVGSLLSGWAEGIRRELDRAALHVTNLYDDLKLQARGNGHVERRLAAS